MGRAAQKAFWVAVLMAATLKCSSSQNLPASSASGATTGGSVTDVDSHPSGSHSVACNLRVTSQHNYLTVTAKRCPLADVLIEIKHQIGAAVDIPNGEAQELVWVEAGPAPVHDVLTSLLYGSSVDYVILGSRSDPNQVTHVILTAQHANSKGNEVAKTTPVDSTDAGAQEEAPYGVGFSLSPDTDTDNENQTAPISRSAAVAAQQSPNGQKTQGQILDELQKEQMKKLDEKANSSPQ